MALDVHLESLRRGLDVDLHQERTEHAMPTKLAVPGDPGDPGDPDGVGYLDASDNALEDKKFIVEFFNNRHPSRLALPPSAYGMAKMDPNTKLLLLMRHGQAVHNLGPAKYGWKRWMAVEARTDAYFDAPLTALGRTQAQNASFRLRAAANADGLHIDRVIVSPLMRTLQTARLATQGGALTGVTGRFEAVELLRERMGMYPCDSRHGRDFLEATFGDIADFRYVPRGSNDTYWMPEHRESEARVEERVLRFLKWLWLRHPDDNVLLVVTHSHFIRALYNVLRLSPLERPGNADVIPIVLNHKNPFVYTHVWVQDESGRCKLTKPEKVTAASFYKPLILQVKCIMA
eukprot:g1423.t1